MRKTGILILTLLAATAGAQMNSVPSQGGEGYSLEQARKYAMTNSYSIQDKEMEIDKAKATIRQALALWLPQMNAGYDAIWNAQIQPQAISKDAGFIPPDQFPPGEDFIYLPFGTEYQTTWNVGASFNLSYTNFLANKASRILKKTKSLDLEDARINAVNEVEKAYYMVLVASENERLLQENLATLNQNFNETKALYDNGFVEQQSVDQLELLVSNLTNNLNNARRQKELALMMLKFNMGMDMEREIYLTDDLDKFIAIGELNEETTTFNVVNHIQYRKVSTQLDAALLNTKNEKSKWFPSLNLSVNHTESYFSNEFDPVNWDTYWAPGTRLVGGLAWNINPLGRTAAIQEAKVDAEKAELASELTRNKLSLEYQQALSDYNFALANYKTQKRNVEISTNIQNKERTKFKEGISGSLELTQAENQYLETQQSYIQSLLNLLNARENLDKALGQP